MADERWRRMWDVFHEAVERAPGERAAFLDGACAGDESLRRELEEMLASHEQSPSFLERPDLLEPLLQAEDWAERLVGERIGHYRIAELIGEGGMGVVYAAEQQEPIRRRVALKLIKLGMDTREVIARFESERQALALMDHPHIAMVHDAGVTGQGRPYFVMEMVQGVRITEYCDQHRLTTRERLELFIPVCQAVQHAHQKGIIHRDLKPSNVLVTLQDGKPVPKIIDFGVAKAIEGRLTDRTLQTEHGKLIGTPEYMSPEQGDRDLDIDTRTDVYSLGVLLYELLVGTLPFDPDRLRKAGYAEIQRMIREEDPLSPSTRISTLGDNSGLIAERRSTDPVALRRQLRGELDWIVMKALEKDRARRYGTASELAADVDRHLKHLPVLAGPPSTAYRARKFVRRHRMGVAVAASFLMLLVGFGVAMWVERERVREARDQAERQLVRAQQVSSFLVDLFERTEGSAPGHTITARELLDRKVERLGEELKDQPEVRAALMDAIGEAYQHLGIFDSAGPMLKEGLEIRRELLGDENLALSDSQTHLGVYYHKKSDFEAAEPLLREALATRRRHLDADHPAVAESLSLLGSLLNRMGEYAESEALLREALEIQRRAGRDDSRLTATILSELAALLDKKGDYDAAEPMYREALSVGRGSGHSTVRILGNFGGMLYNKGDYVAAEPILREALAEARERFGDEHPNVQTSLSNLALVLHHMGDYEAAESMYREGLALTRKTHGDVHESVAIGLNNLALLHHDRGDNETAERLFREALAVQRKVVGNDHPNVAFHLNNLARVLHQRGDYDSAERLYHEALDLRRRKLPEGHPSIAASLGWLGQLLTERGDPEGAEPLLREALEIRRKALPEGDWRTAETESQLGGCLVALGRYAEAEPLLVDSHPILEAWRGASFWRTVAALDRIIELYDAWDRADKADEYRARLPEGVRAASGSP